MSKFKKGNRVVYINVSYEIDDIFGIFYPPMYYYDLLRPEFHEVADENLQTIDESELTLDIAYYRNKKLKELGI